MILALLLACGLGPPSAPPGPPGGTGDPADARDDDTAEPCGECTLAECADTGDDTPATEEDCEALADDLGCEEWEWASC